MELIPYVRAVLRWTWLIVLVAVVAGAGGFLVTKIQRPQYTAKATVQIGSAKYSQNPGTDAIIGSQDLANDYAVLAKTDAIMEAAAKTLTLNIKPGDLSQFFQVNILPNTTLIEIAATHPDPSAASDIANAVATALVASVPTPTLQRQQEQISLLSAEIDTTRAQLDGYRSSLKDTNAAIASAGSSASPDLITRQTTLTDQVHQTQSTLVQLISTLLDVQKQDNSNTLEVVNPAHIPSQPNGPAPTGIIILATVLGGVLATAGIAFREFVKDVIRNPSELSTRFGLDIIGTIAPFGRGNKAANKLIMWRNPHSPVAESYRALRVNLTYNDKQISRHPQVYVITSPNAGDGKSVTAANLAVAFAITGARVLLVDADLRRPTQHNIFNMNNTKGPTDGKLALPETVSASTDGSGSTANLVTKTEVPGLSLITASSIPSTPTEFLGTIQMQDMLYKLSNDDNYDVVIFDTPPLLSVSDSTLVASVTHGNVILVIDPNRTQRGSVIRVVQQLNSLTIPLVGVVLNRFYGRQLDASFGVYLTGRYEAVPSITGRSESGDTGPNPVPIQANSRS